MNLIEVKTQQIIRNIPELFHGLIFDAIELAERIHANQKRKSGDLVTTHLLDVAIEVAALNLDVDSIIVAILHQVKKEGNTLPFGPTIEAEIVQKFGQDVMNMIDTLEKISQVTKKHSEAVALTKYILKGAQDLRILFVRLCDKLDNARTSEILDDDAKKNLAHKLLNLYAPIADYLSLRTFKRQYESFAMQILYPEKYEEVSGYLENLNITEDVVRNVRSKIIESIGELGFKLTVWGRVKSPYSIMKKLRKYEKEGKNPKLTDIKDLIALSIVLEEDNQCYEVCSLLQAKTQCLLNDYEDYILNPKPNGFRQIQINLTLPEITGIVIEVQIMTYEMYLYNNYGGASHYAYKSQGNRFAKHSKEFEWVKQVHNAFRSRPMVTNVFTERLFVFTPKEMIVELPLGSTPIDFAFKVHTVIARRIIGARVNGVDVELSTQLKNGDIVEIVASNNPSIKSTLKSDWLKFVKTTNARKEIEKYTKRW